MEYIIFGIGCFLFGILIGVSFYYRKVKMYKYKKDFLEESIQNWDLQELSKLRKK